MRKYYIWWEQGRLTITADKPNHTNDYVTTYQSDVVVKNWHNSIDWYSQVQAVLLDLWNQERG